jgi:hypothetical protein
MASLNPGISHLYWLQQLHCLPHAILQEIIEAGHMRAHQPLKLLRRLRPLSLTLQHVGCCCQRLLAAPIIGKGRQQPFYPFTVMISIPSGVLYERRAASLLLSTRLLLLLLLPELREYCRMINALRGSYKRKPITLFLAILRTQECSSVKIEGTRLLLILRNCCVKL